MLTNKLIYLAITFLPHVRPNQILTYHWHCRRLNNIIFDNTPGQDILRKVNETDAMFAMELRNNL